MNPVNKILGYDVSKDRRVGHECDICGHTLDEDEFTSYGKWDYKCKKCGFTYKHGVSILK